MGGAGMIRVSSCRSCGPGSSSGATRRDFGAGGLTIGTARASACVVTGRAAGGHWIIRAQWGQGNQLWSGSGVCSGVMSSGWGVGGVGTRTVARVGGGATGGAIGGRGGSVMVRQRRAALQTVV